MPDYFPNGDQEAEAWMTNFVAGLTTHAVELDVDVADITPLGTSRTDFSTALTDHVTKQNDARAATAEKNTKRGSMESLARTMVRRISTAPGMTDTIRADLGLNIPSGSRTPSSVGPEVPGISLETRLGQVIVHWGTDPENEFLNGKPSWAKGAIIYRKQAEETEFRMINFATSSPYVDTIEGPASDYTYAVRYRGTKADQIGAQSAEVTVAAMGMVAA